MDVICAPATPLGRGALAIIRFSGEGVDALRDRLCRPLFKGSWRPFRQRRVFFLAGDSVIDDGVAVYCPGPRTFTGEDTLEITLHGNPLLVNRCMEAAREYGARLADPGEFTRRAVIHGRMDLVRAEGIDQLIRARSHAGVEVGRQAVDGAFHQMVGPVRKALVSVVSELEAWLDHGDDELALASDEQVIAELQRHSLATQQLAATYDQGRRLVDGATVALIGPANVGKSSLFNRLLGRTAAVVHNTPGTTRDVVEGRVLFGSLEVTLLDTAGERQTSDEIEAAGLELARERVKDADLILIVGRVEEGIEEELVKRIGYKSHLLVLNGVDRVASSTPGVLFTSAKTGEGLSALKDRIHQELVGLDPSFRLMIASHRQQQLLLTVAQLINTAISDWQAGPAVVADGLTMAIEALDSLTGADTREEVLDAVFQRFCIGK